MEYKQGGASLSVGQKLLRQYRECYNARYSFPPMINESSPDRILETVAKQIGENDARKAMHHYFKMNDEDFLKYKHSLKGFTQSLNRIRASVYKDREKKTSHPSMQNLVQVAIPPGKEDYFTCKKCGKSGASFIHPDGEYIHKECRDSLV